MAQYIVVDFTKEYGNGEELCKKYHEIWKKGYGFVKYIHQGAKVLMLCKRGADYSDMATA